jgi:hypothetical protein
MSEIAARPVYWGRYTLRLADGASAEEVVIAGGPGSR